MYPFKSSVFHALTRVFVVASVAVAGLAFASPAQAVEPSVSVTVPLVGPVVDEAAVLASDAVSDLVGDAAEGFMAAAVAPSVTPRVAARRRPVATDRVMGVAAAQSGDPYVYGATGPNAFDCSGLTSFVYRVAAHRTLPRTSSAQFASTIRIPRQAARAGDLVFFHGSSGVYHVGIFAGGNSLIHASKPGGPVGKTAIWTSAVTFGRVR